MITSGVCFPQDTLQKVKVAKVLSGDRFITDNNIEVRLLGIKTPPSDDSLEIAELSERTGIKPDTIKILGGLCREFAENYLLGNEVQLIKDSYSTDTDTSGRLLRYVYLDDGTFFNKTLLLYGYAFVNSAEQDSFREARRFTDTMLYIKNYFLGLWINPNFRKLQAAY